MPIDNDPNWWRQAVVYQIYPRSFADTDGDGIGNINGITEKVPYLKQLGVNAVWLSPFYSSPLNDGGYDVADYRNVDPRLGTLEDFDAMVAALHDAGIRVVVDIVPNHSSSDHEWFQAALAAPKGSPERERYIFRDGLGEGGAEPPADWVAAFGGPAWEPVGDGQWYLHLFDVTQPDFNWENPEVRADFLHTLRFWSERGVDGFRVDIANGLVKDLSADPLPKWADITGDAITEFGTDPLWDREGLTDIYRDWRAVFNEYNPPRAAVAEAWVRPERRYRYANPDSLGQAFNFDLLDANFSATEFREIIDRNLEFARTSGSSNTWVLSNHDMVRHATRYGLPDDKPGEYRATGRQWVLDGTPPLDADRGLRRARAATLLLLALPGSTYIYQGEELGLPEVAEIPDAERQDPTFFRSPGVDKGRDGCRVPPPWQANAPSFGFSHASGGSPSSASHLPQPPWFGEFAADQQDGVAGSTLELYRQAIAARKGFPATEALVWQDCANPQVIAFERPGGWLNVTNFGTQPVPLPPGEIVVASGPITTGDDVVGLDDIVGPGASPAGADIANRLLPGETTAWLRIEVAGTD
jgi:alpha-glucosidase